MKMYNNIIKIAYKPSFSIGFYAFLKSFVNPSMRDMEDETHQYFVETIQDMIEELNFDLSYDDEQLLNNLINVELVQYIEF